jgi:magnesium chelatase family protein
MEGISKVYVPTIMAREAAAQPNVTVYGVDSLQQLVDHLSGKTLIEPTSSDYVVPTSMSYGGIDLSNIRGQQKGVRALEIAAAGGHHIAFHGPAGTGKTLLARALVGILPPMTLGEKLAVTSAHSAAGLTRGQGLIQNRPFRCPHPTASETACVGGGVPPLPGELTLAHHGVIMLDDVTEFRRATLDAMAAPVADGVSTLIRSKVKYYFPSEVQMVLASLPCPCGYLGDPRMSCRCLPEHVKPHLERLDTKLYKLVDIVCPLDHVNPAAAAPGDSSAVVQARVIKAREMAYERWGGNVTNSQMVGASMNRAELTFLIALSSAMKVTDSLPLRRVARTIADLAGSEEVKRDHLLEAFDFSRERVLGV